MVDLLAELKKNPFVLAPMAGITDYPFRSFMKELGCSIVITELVSANGLKFSSEKTKRIMRLEDLQRPVGIQLFGETPEIIAEGAKFAQDYGADFIDLNFGCPVKKVVSKGAGSAVLKDLKRLQKILSTVKSAIGIPLTIKIRTGWDDENRNALEVAKIAYNEGVTWVAIHGRTRAQAYSGQADWDYIREVKEESPLPILGNGDITSPELAVKRMADSDCDGVMIGRGCLKNPYIFQQSMKLWCRDQSTVELNYPEAIDRLLSYLHRSCTDQVVNIQLKKLAAWYSSGYPGSSSFRKSLYDTSSLDEAKDLTRDYFSEVQRYVQKDTSHEAFLMGGHG